MIAAPPLYVYGVLSTPARLAGVPLGEGVNGSAVRLLQTDVSGQGGLGALVSEAGGTVAQTRRNMVSHTAVLERAMAYATTLPVRFGTVAPSGAALVGCLAGQAAAFAEALGRIDGRVELGVKASWRQGVVLSDIMAEDHALSDFRDRLRHRPAAETYFDRVELGRRIEQALAARRDTAAAGIMAALGPLAEREVELRLLGEDMILNRAFLVRREHEAQFDARMQDLAGRCAPRMDFRYIGPVPPYNFVQLQAGWLAEAA
jgi:hypothetical protein